jgi:hypothetical protein
MKKYPQTAERDNIALTLLEYQSDLVQQTFKRQKRQQRPQPEVSDVSYVPLLEAQAV